jgi:hypothetical protein
MRKIWCFGRKNALKTEGTEENEKAGMKDLKNRSEYVTEAKEVHASSP